MRLLPTLFMALATPSLLSGQTLPHFLRDYRAAENTHMRVTAFADGSLQDALQEGSQPAGSGRVGLLLGLEKWVIQGNISFASSVDQITSGYGLTILNPTSGGAQPAAILEIAKPDVWFGGDPSERHWGWSAYLSLAQADWVRDTTSVSEGLPPSAVANTVGLGGLLYHSITGVQEDNTVGMSFGAGPTFRRVYGEADSGFRREVLGTGDDTFFGLEGFFALTVNGITAYTQVYAMEQGDIAGLSGLNAVFGITLRGNVFKLDFARDPTAEDDNGS